MAEKLYESLGSNDVALDTALCIRAGTDTGSGEGVTFKVPQVTPAMRSWLMDQIDSVFKELAIKRELASMSAMLELEAMFKR